MAARAGTSPAVVSYVVNSGPRPVAPATRQKVLDAIEALGYRPNRAAKTLASKRSNTLGLVVPDTTNAFFSDLSQAVEQHARSLGLITLIGSSGYDHARERDYVETFNDYGADGIIVVSAELSAPWQASVTAPLVFIHRRPSGARGPVVRGDDHGGARLATEHLLALGRGGVHCIAGHEKAGPIEDRVQGWLGAHEAQPQSQSEPGSQLGPRSGSQSGSQAQSEPDFGGPRPVPGDLLRVSYPRGAAAGDLAGWLAALEQPSAVFVTTDEQAIGLLSAASTAGIRVPDDLAVVAFDNTSAAAYTVPPLTTVMLPYDEMARRAVDRVVVGESEVGESEVGEAGGAAGEVATCATDLVIRRSCGRPERR